MRSDSPAAGRQEALPLWSVLALAAGLRLAGLGRSELWFDEAYAALVSLEPWRRIVHELSRDSSPPLYYFLLRLWRLAFGPTTVALRVPSAAAGIGAVYVVDRLGREAWNARVGRWAALLLAITPLHVYYSQEARPYSLLVLVSALSLLGLERLHRHTSRSAAALFVIATTVACYTHNYGVLLLLPLAASVAAGRLPLRAASGMLILIVAVYVWWLPMLARQVTGGAAAWVSRIWVSTPPALAPIVSLESFAIGGAAPAYVQLGAARASSWVHLLAYSMAAILGASALSRNSPGYLQSRQAVAAIGLLLGAPWLISFLFPVYVAARYDIVALPLFTLVIGAGLEAFGPRRAAGVLLAALAVVSLAAYYRRPPLQGARAQALLLRDYAGPRDAVVAVGFTRNPLEYYSRIAGAQPQFYSFPRSLGEHRGWLDERELDDQEAIAQQAVELVADISTGPHRASRLWVVHSDILGNVMPALLYRVNQLFIPVQCPGAAEARGISCWARRREDPE